jgi:predicted nucleic acid-binding protein
VVAGDALALALETQLTVYAAAYFCLAKSLKCALVTFDEALARQIV